MSNHPFFKHFWPHCLLIISLLLLAYGAYAVFHNIQNNAPARIVANQTQSCSLSDKTFCSTDQQFKNFVSDQELSDILEKQQPTNITCSNAVQLKAYCRGIQNGLVLQLFQIYQGQNPTFLTRNQYLVFFRSYFSQYGPMEFTGDTSEASNMTMNFANANRTAHYMLTFDHARTTWELAAVTVSTP